MGRFAWAAGFVAAARPVARDVCARSTVRPARAEVGVGARGELSRFAGRRKRTAHAPRAALESLQMHQTWKSAGNGPRAVGWTKSLERGPHRRIVSAAWTRRNFDTLRTTWTPPEETPRLVGFRR